MTTEFQRYQTAAQTFRDKYRSIPGDIRDATRFWGKDAAACNADAGVASTPGTCNGDGDGNLEQPSVANATGEIYQFWKHLALAGMIEGNYSGLAGAGSVRHAVIETNIPASKLSLAGWSLVFVGSYPGDGEAYAMDYGHVFTFGASTSTDRTLTAILRPEEAWNIDSKIDDGRPAYGRVIGRRWNNACAAADDGTHANNDLNASYRLSDTSIQCALDFRNPF